MAKLFLKDLDSGNWQLTIICTSLTSAIGFLKITFYCKESPRYLVAIQKLEKGVKILKKMRIKNRNDDLQSIDESDIARLREWRNQTFD